MNLDYLAHNAAYVATMEEAIGRLQADGRFLTTQSLYAFVGQAVAGSYAKVAAFLKERGDAPPASRCLLGLARADWGVEYAAWHV
jgi:hypothetical protein